MAMDNAPAAQIVEVGKPIVLVQAAVKKDGKIFSGKWHSECRSAAEVSWRDDTDTYVEGFLTDEGVFVSRAEEDEMYRQGRRVEDRRGY